MWLRILTMLVSLSLAACQSAPDRSVPTANKIDLPRFMGDWYVLASIPTYLERDAFNAVESYRLNPDGSIATTFTFNKGSIEGPRKQLTPTGLVKDTVTNAEWRMRFYWVVRAEYLINWVNEDYTQTIIARNKRDYVWIMARTPRIPEAEYEALVNRVHRLGYDALKLRRVPHQVAR